MANYDPWFKHGSHIKKTLCQIWPDGRFHKIIIVKSYKFLKNAASFIDLRWSLFKSSYKFMQNLFENYPAALKLKNWLCGLDVTC